MFEHNMPPCMQEKCRVPVAQGVVLIGILDETGTLPTGTFYASWDRPQENNDDPYATSAPQPLPAGTRALVSRNPVVSPADLRILRAADPENLPSKLTSLTNVVVFPKVGQRPEQCKMSGGDLDGDIFFIIWDEKLIPPAEATANDYRCAPELSHHARKDLNEWILCLEGSRSREVVGVACVFKSAHLFFACTSRILYQRPRHTQKSLDYLPTLRSDA